MKKTQKDLLNSITDFAIITLDHCELLRLKIFIQFFPLRIEETDDSRKTDPDNNLSRAVNANTLFPPGIEK